MDYNPAGQYLMLKPEHTEEESDGGIIIPEQARRLLNEGEILKVGPLVTNPLYRIGMFVVFEPASEHELEIEKGVRVLVVHENNITMWRNPPKTLFPASGNRSTCDEHGWEGAGPCPICQSKAEFGQAQAKQNPEHSVGGGLGRELK